MILFSNLLLFHVVIIAFYIFHVAETEANESFDDGPFFFTGEPEGQTLKEGEEAKLNCTLDREPTGLKYYWYKYGNDDIEGSLLQVYSKNSSTNLLDGENGKELNFSSISRHDRGYYQCRVQTDFYTLFSGVAYVEVNYFDEPAAQVTLERKTVQAYAEQFFLPCATVQSSPVVGVFWNKDGVRILEEERFFVYPEDYYYGSEKRARGGLLILNVDPDEDGGRYECHTEKTEDFAETILSAYQVTVSDPIGDEPDKVLRPVFKSFAGSGGVVHVESGGTVELARAGSGNPLPDYTWRFTNTDVRIVSTESHQLKDDNRRLVVNNIEEDSEYECIMSQTFNGRFRERSEYFVVIVTEKAKNSDIEFIDRSNGSRVNILRPNQYQPFTMGCHVRKSGDFTDYQILWLKNGNKTDWISRGRIRKQSELEQRSDTELESETDGVDFFFKIPNESDLGVYQCVVVSTEGSAVKVKQETSYITLERDNVSRNYTTRQPNYRFLTGPFYVDEAEEACKEIDMHLVSILDHEENQAVQDLVRRNNESNVWIGLTREVPDPIGTWKWTLPGDSSFSYSNWDHEKPDNYDGRQEYAVMENDTGRWVDVQRDALRRPAVCKNYSVVCPSVDQFYQGRVRVRGWESIKTSYYVGQQVEVFCRYPNKTAARGAQLITCGLDTNFDQLTMDDCLDHDSFFGRLYPTSSVSHDPPHISVLLILHSIFALRN